MRNLKILPCPFGKIVFEARKKQNISRYKLAQLTGRSAQQLAKIEKGENEPVISTIVGLAYALGLDPCELFCETVKLMPIPHMTEGADMEAHPKEHSEKSTEKDRQ